MRGENVVVDSAALLDLFVATDVGLLLDMRLEGCTLHTPDHVDAEVFEGIGRLTRAGVLSPSRAFEHLQALAAAPIERHPVQTLLEGAWRRQGELSAMTPSDALYVELARSLGLALITTDPRLARACEPVAELVTRASEGAA